MSLTTFLAVVIVSTFMAFLWQLVFHIYPAYKKLKISQSLAILAKCITRFDKEVLSSSLLTDGHYLHDKFYKLLFATLTHKVNLKRSMLKHVKYDQTSETEYLKFRAEIDSLDDNIKSLIADASFSVAKILILRNPIIFFRICLQIRQEKHGFRTAKDKPHIHCKDSHVVKAKSFIRSKMVLSTEYITANAKDDDYNFTKLLLDPIQT